MKVAFICVNYNNSKITTDYVLNVLSLKENLDIKIIVVDNASEKKDVNDLVLFITDLRNEDVLIIKSETNLGYFKGLNLGVKKALELGYNEYQIVGNNDLEFHADFLIKLNRLQVEKDELVIAPDVITIDGIHENPHVINRLSFLRKFKYKIYYSSYFLARIITQFYSIERKPKSFDPKRKHIHMGIGALYVLTPNFFNHFDQLWEDVFLYGEEAILAGQIMSVNGKILYEPDLKCNHNESASTSKMDSKYKYQVVRESHKIYKKYL